MKNIPIDVLCKLYHWKVLRSEPPPKSWILVSWLMYTGGLWVNSSLMYRVFIQISKWHSHWSCDKAAASYGRRGNLNYYSEFLFPPGKDCRLPTSIAQEPVLSTERMPKINPVPSSRCFFLLLAGKVSHVMTIIMINQWLLRNLQIVSHLSQELFEALWHSDYSTKLCAL